MYTKYNTCPPQPRPLQRVSGAPCIHPRPVTFDNTKPGAIPESVRAAAWQCSTATVCVANAVEYGPACPTTLSGATKVSVPVPAGSSAPVVTVQNVPASATVAQRARESLERESNPYNPQTRFAAYFPPAPLPYICPERIPNNDSKGSTRECVPLSRFQGSAQAAGLV
jgi:hypothetical protein